MSAAALIFPHQLFEAYPTLLPDLPVIMVEEYLFFRQLPFHKQKLILHRASMRGYAQWLSSRGCELRYIETEGELSDLRLLVPQLASEGIKCLHYIDPVDDWLERRLIQSAEQHGVQCVKYRTPSFLNSLEEVSDFFASQKSYFQTAFYIDQRKRRNIFLDDKGKPIGGKWSFDSDNRKKYPSAQSLPAISFAAEDTFTREARDYIRQHFPNNPGNLDTFIYPVDHKGAEQWLEQFLVRRYAEFGTFQDAIVADAHFMLHSLLSPLLNIGLLTPDKVLAKALAVGKSYGIPFNSQEGLIRQILGWREFVRIVYVREGRKQRRCNFWGFKRKIPPGFWRGQSGIDPLDCVINKLLKHAYNHHIERLMVLGNFMLLCEFDPDQVYDWFMSLYIDAYDWVMVPNVYGMSQYADGGLMTTKPYISGSHYLLKMSDFPKGEWTRIWDGLFWRFMYVRRDVLARNTRLAMLIKQFDNMEVSLRAQHLEVAENYLRSLD